VNVSSYKLIPSEGEGSDRIVPVARKLTLRNWVVEIVVPDSFFPISSNYL
jgi:hypothetical protein